MRDYYFNSSPNRTICSVLEEIRKMYETRNFSGLLGAVEEAQGMANRMEAKLYTMKDIERGEEIKSNLKKEIAALKAKKDELSGGTDD